MDEYTIKLSGADIEWLLSVLTRTPLALVESQPRVQKIASQAEAQRIEMLHAKAEADTKAAAPVAKGKG